MVARHKSHESTGDRIMRHKKTGLRLQHQNNAWSSSMSTVFWCVLYGSCVCYSAFGIARLTPHQSACKHDVSKRMSWYLSFWCWAVISFTSSRYSPVNTSILTSCRWLDRHISCPSHNERLGRAHPNPTISNIKVVNIKWVGFVRVLSGLTT